MEQTEFQNDLNTFSDDDWRIIERLVFNLQKRIYKASQTGKLTKAKSLIRLLYGSSSAILVAIRQVTQDAQEQSRLANKLIEYGRSGWHGYRAHAIKKDYIIIKNGEKRPLAVPSLDDKVIQHVVKFALEPYYEAQFEPSNFSFRPGMGVHDAINSIFQSLSKKPKWVLKARIEGFFDNLDHDFLLNCLDDKRWKRPFNKWLKVGYVDNKHLDPTSTPQYGIISPLIANIVLDGMERYLKAEIEKVFSDASTLKVIRYSCEILVIHEDNQIILQCQERLKKWLGDRGLTQVNTQVVQSTENFDFLTYNIQFYAERRINAHYKRQLISQGKYKKEFLNIRPSASAIKKHRDVIREVFDKMKAAPQDALIRRLNPIIRAWTHEYRHVTSRDTFSKLDYWLWEKLWKWSKRRHPNKGSGWVKAKYFTKTQRKSSDFITDNQSIHWYGMVKTSPYQNPIAGKSYYESEYSPFSFVPQRSAHRTDTSVFPT